MKKSVLLIGDVMRDIIVKPEGELRIGSDQGAKIAMKPGGGRPVRPFGWRQGK